MGKREIFYKENWNIYLIIMSYFINNCVSGVVYDVYVNYLQEVDTETAKSFWGYYGYSMFISAIFIMFINKLGYRKILMISVFSCTLGLFGVHIIKASVSTKIFTLLLLNGIQLHYLILLPFINKYSNEKRKVKWFSRAYYIGYIGFFVTTYFGGYFTVKFLSNKLQLSYLQAKTLTNSLNGASNFIREKYVDSMEELLLLVGVISILGLVPVFFIKENKSDYNWIEKKEWSNIREIFRKRKEIFNKYSILYCFYWGINNFSIGLFVPYYTIYLNRYLNIDKVTTSLIISISYVAVVLFMFFTDFISKKIGRVKTLYISILLSLPFMFIVAEGSKFEKNTALIIGGALFMRTGIMNLNAPIDSSLAADMVDKKLLPLYTGILSFIVGITGVLSGQFTGRFLFNLENGYKLGYYLAALLYFVGAIIVFVWFSKFDEKYNQENINAGGENG